MDERKFLIRRATEADAVEICNVHTKSIREVCCFDYDRAVIDEWAGFRTPDQYLETMRKERRVIWVAEFEGAVVGFSALAQNHVIAVYIHPQYLRLGLGRKLYNALEQDALVWGFTELTVHSSYTALEFYRCLGFVDIEETHLALPSGQPLVCVLMKKQLHSSPVSPSTLPDTAQSPHKD